MTHLMRIGLLTVLLCTLATGVEAQQDTFSKVKECFTTGPGGAPQQIPCEETTHAGRQVTWLGKPVIEKDRQNIVWQAVEHDYELGLRDDGVVVWRKQQERKERR